MAGPKERPARAASAGTAGTPAEPSTAVVVLLGPIGRADVPVLCERVRGLMQGCDAELVVCDVGGLEPDTVTVDALARLQLTARRLGRRIRLRHACGELQGLLTLTGLSEVIPCSDASSVQPRRQAEEREQARRVEEERDPGDPPR